MNKITAPEWAITREAKLSSWASVTMTAGPAGFTCEWEPELGPWISRQELSKYRKARNQLLAEVERTKRRLVETAIDGDGGAATHNLKGD